MNISVIGAGTMGNGIAHVFAQNGFSVNLIDVSQEQLDKAVATIEKNLERQIAKGTLSEESKQTALSNLKGFVQFKEITVQPSCARDKTLQQKLFNEI